MPFRRFGRRPSPEERPDPSAPPDALARALEDTEARLAEAQRRTEEALERQLREVRERIAAAERRASEAEERARAAAARPEADENTPQPTVAEAPAPPPEPPETPSEAPLNLNEASYEQLRSLRLSVTQTGRLLAYREREGGFRSLDELERIPGFPRGQLDELRRKLTV